jgi:hypothetical protein
VTLQFPFWYPHLYKPLISTLWASFAPFSFRESERSLGVRVYLRFSRGKRILLEFFKICHSIHVFRVSKKFQVLKLKLLIHFHLFSQLKAFFHKTYKLFFHQTPWDQLITPGWKNTFSSKYHEIHLIIDWNIFLHDPTWKYHLMRPCSNFQFLVEVSPPTHDFGCSTCLSS